MRVCIEEHPTLNHIVKGFIYIVKLWNLGEIVNMFSCIRLDCFNYFHTISSYHMYSRLILFSIYF
jgi:hypothetical protein